MHDMFDNDNMLRIKIREKKYEMSSVSLKC